MENKLLKYNLCNKVKEKLSIFVDVMFCQPPPFEKYITDKLALRMRRKEGLRDSVSPIIESPELCHLENDAKRDRK